MISADGSALLAAQDQETCAPGAALPRPVQMARPHSLDTRRSLRRGPEDPEPLLWEAVCEGTAPRHARGAACGAHDRLVAADERALSEPAADQRALPASGCPATGDGRGPRAPGLLALMGAADDGWLGARRDHLGDPTDAELVGSSSAPRSSGRRRAWRHGTCGYRPQQFAEGHRLELKHGYARARAAAARLQQALGWESPQSEARAGVARPHRMHHVCLVQGRQHGDTVAHRPKGRLDRWSACCSPAVRPGAWATSVCAGSARGQSSST